MKQRVQKRFSFFVSGFKASFKPNQNPLGVLFPSLLSKHPESLRTASLPTSLASFSNSRIQPPLSTSQNVARPWPPLLPPLLRARGRDARLLSIASLLPAAAAHAPISREPDQPLLHTIRPPREGFASATRSRPLLPSLLFA
ncbi:hypothetical protein VIGAN_UM072400 [Vigna angularis var. angularis]|uniref:Uncharacterized protein n=1 Tax=Vigna angularis var. angularis TaxID=157739 RepID=A0A0S3TDW1_PHAAN|nr:hypothetical protein VIGAN_UM072400 [Vigna angularis var. angularis]